jgi:hypothetical protein
MEDRLPVAGDEERVCLLYALYELGVRDVLSEFLVGLRHDFYRVRCATANLSCQLADASNRDDIVSALRTALERETSAAARTTIEDALADLAV